MMLKKRYGLLLICLMVAAASDTNAKTHTNQSSRLFPILTYQGWGYINDTGHVVIKPQFRDVGPFFEERACAVTTDGGKTGYIDETGKMVFETPLYLCFAFDTEGFSEGLAAVKVPEKLGYLDKTGKSSTPPAHRSVIAAEKWGYLDKTGKVAIKLQFHSAESFSEGLAAITTNDTYKVGYIDKTGKIVIEPQFEAGWPFAEGLAKVKMTRKYGYIDKMGTVVIPPQFLEARKFSEGLAAVTTDGLRWGYIDRAGHYVIDPQFGEARDFSEGLAAVVIGLSATEYQEGLTAELGAAELTKGLSTVVRKGTWGYLDKTGAVVISPQFYSAKDFSEGLAIVSRTFPIGGTEILTWKYGYIDRTGAVVLPPRFSHAEAFSGGLAYVSTPFLEFGCEVSRSGYVDKRGRYIWKSPFFIDC